MTRGRAAQRPRVIPARGGIPAVSAAGARTGQHRGDGGVGRRLVQRLVTGEPARTFESVASLVANVVSQMRQAAKLCRIHGPGSEGLLVSPDAGCSRGPHCFRMQQGPCCYSHQAGQVQLLGFGTDPSRGPANGTRRVDRDNRRPRSGQATML